VENCLIKKYKILEPAKHRNQLIKSYKPVSRLTLNNNNSSGKWKVESGFN